MVQSALLVSFVLGLGLLSVVVLLTGRGWRTYSVAGGWTTRPRPSALARGADSPAVWTAAFVAVTLAFGGAAILFVGGTEIPEGMAAMGGVVLVGLATLVFGSYVFYGTFVSARNRGLKNSQAALLGAWAIGALFLVAVTLKLFGLF
ncbi:hypothetical protein [Halogeometricum limi]|uniref:Uncharacterized protein n=1 Tax=Halogeometricum limi TaxID=555875 RepID=A0A1I6IQG5_9EURY|nr:hypothetical protein [Halogeometricum limi]SFR68985.1 hypothetical protein SAMN04488124_3511 [Halogeometricum limi]